MGSCSEGRRELCGSIEKLTGLLALVLTIGCVSQSGLDKTRAFSGTRGIGSASCATTAGWLDAHVAAAVARRARFSISHGLGGEVFTTTTVMSVHPCIRAVAGARPLDASTDLAVVVMAGSVRLERARAAASTWASMLPREAVLFVGDVNDEASGMITLPSLAGRAGYHDAQHRTLRGLQHLVATPSRLRDARWVLLVDDDTYVNVPELLGLVAPFNSDAPLLMGHFFYGPEERGGDEISVVGGGGGMLLSRRAAERVAAALYTPACPYLPFNDVTISHCASTLGVAKVHSPLFDVLAEWQVDVGKYHSTLPLSVMVTLHYVKTLEEFKRVHDLTARQRDGVAEDEALARSAPEDITSSSFGGGAPSTHSGSFPLVGLVDASKAKDSAEDDVDDSWE